MHTASRSSIWCSLGAYLQRGAQLRQRGFVTAPGHWIVLAFLAASCGPASVSPAAGPASTAQSASTGPQRITVALLGVLPAFWDNLGARGGVVPGAGDFKGFASAGLVVMDDKDALRPQLSDAIPSVENGLWIVSPDGRMETTWRIREGARWHDGRPMTS